MVTLIDLIWPTLEPTTRNSSGQDSAKLEIDLNRIAAAKPTSEVNILVEESRRLLDSESDRRTSAETRATTYLAAAGVLAPILAAIAPTTLKPQAGILLPVLSLLFFVAAGTYLIASAAWSFRALRVAPTHRLDAADLVDVWEGAAPSEGLAKGLLMCARLNRAETNHKVTFVKMSREFAMRAIITFVLASFS